LTKFVQLLFKCVQKHMLRDVALSLINSGALRDNILKQATTIPYIIFENSSFLIIFASQLALCDFSISCNVVTL